MKQGRLYTEHVHVGDTKIQCMGHFIKTFPGFKFFFVLL